MKYFSSVLGNQWQQNSSFIEAVSAGRRKQMAERTDSEPLEAAVMDCFLVFAVVPYVKR